jgi:tetratricopeptide (TPR) repeat protein
MKTIRIFISSPGDVAEEREKAKQVIARLQARYVSEAELLPILWEDLPLQADTPFQEGIEVVLARNAGIDIAVFVLWSRLGSPLGSRVTKPDGTPYRSGTEREFDLMLNARATAVERGDPARPAIIAYTREDDETWNKVLDPRAKSSDELKGLLEQRDLARLFIREQFQDAEGHNLRAYHTYRNPPDFCGRLRTHLIGLLDELVGPGQGGGSWEGSPYVGLSAFNFDQEPIFRGREREVCELAERLRQRAAAGCAFVLVAGASGSGKSSLVRAGLLPALCLHELDDEVAQWRRAILLPSLHGGNLLLALLRAISDEHALPEMHDVAPAGLERLAVDLRASPDTIVANNFAMAFQRAAEAARGPVRLVLVVDQLEEIFTGGAIPAADRQAFFDVLDALARSGHIWVVATLRSDYYALAQTDETLMKLRADVAGASGLFDLVAVEQSALHRVIVQPARMAGMGFEPATTAYPEPLDQRVLSDALKHPEALPHLQFLLQELYERRDRKTHLLTHQAYDDLGGVGGVLGRRAQLAFDTVAGQLGANPADAAFHALMRALVTIQTEGRQRPVRRRTPLSLASNNPAAKQLCEALVAARLLIADRDTDGEPVVAVGHETLFDSWPLLADWINDNRDFLKERARVESATQTWHDHGRNSGDLLPPGLPLERALDLLAKHPRELDPEATAFIQASSAAAEANRRQELQRLSRRNLIYASLAAAAVVAAILAGFQWREADTQKNQAESARQRAETARGQAEELISFMTFNLRDKLAGVGKLDVFDDINQAVERYHQQREKLMESSGDVLSDAQLRRRSVSYNNLADILVKQGNLPEAEKHYRKVLEIAETLAARAPGNADWQRDLSVSHIKLGDFMTFTGNLPEAEKSYRKSHALFETLAARAPGNADWQRNLSFSHTNLGDFMKTAGHLSEAEKHYRKALEIRETLAARNPSNANWQRDFIVSHISLGDLMEATGDLTETEKSYRKALEIAQTLAARDPGNADSQRYLFLSHYSLGNSMKASGNLPEAEKHYRKALKIAQTLAAHDPNNTQWQSDLYVGYQRLGDFMKAAGDLTEAEKNARKALEIAETLAARDPSNANWQRNLSIVYDNLADFMKASGDLSEAEKHYRKVLEIFETLAAHDPGNAGWQHDFSVSHYKLGNFMTATGNLPEAEKHHRKALEIRETLAARDPGNADWQRSLSLTHIKLGDLMKATNNLPEAEKHYRKDLEIAETLAARDPGNADWQRDLTVSLGRLGDFMMATGNQPEVEKHYRKALELFETRAARNPSNADWQRALSVSHIKLGHFMTATGNLTEAEKHYRKALEIDEPLAARDPGNADWLLEISVSHERMGDFMTASGNLNEAGKHYRKALEIAESLAAREPGNADWQRGLFVCYAKMAELEEQQDAEKARVWCRKAHEQLLVMKRRGIMKPTDEKFIEFTKRKAGL